MLYDKLTQEELDWNGTWTGFPTSPELRQWQEESSEKRVALIKQKLVDLGYTDAAGNVLEPEMAVLPKTQHPSLNGAIRGVSLTPQNSSSDVTERLEIGAKQRSERCFTGHHRHRDSTVF